MEERINYVRIKAAGYRRVSMRDQVNGYSLDAQETNITRYIHDRGWDLVDIYIDAGISAKKGSHRPAFDRLMQDAKSGKFNVVVVDKVDRFYRHLSGLLNALDELNSCGVSFASVQEQLDFTSPWGKLMLTVLGTLAEIYLDNLRHETRKGQIQRARQGNFLGEIPFGYCKGVCSKCIDPNGKDYCPNFGNIDLGNGKVLIPHPIESPLVKQVFDLYIKGDQSHRSIADYLNKTNITLPDGSIVQARQKGHIGRTSPRPFTRDLIRDMIKRITYIGKIALFSSGDDGKHRKRKEPIEIFQGNHQALVSDEVFERAQEVRVLLSSNPHDKQRCQSRIYPLTGILRCGRCGSTMRGKSNGYIRYYTDGNKTDHLNCCEQSSTPAEPIEEKVLAWIRSVVDRIADSKDDQKKIVQLEVSSERYERAKELYLAGELIPEQFKTEKDRWEKFTTSNNSGYNAVTTLAQNIQSEINSWFELSYLKKKRLFRGLVGTAILHGNALLALEPTAAFLPLIQRLQSCNSGEGGIRTRDWFNPALT